MNLESKYVPDGVTVDPSPFVKGVLNPIVEGVLSPSRKGVLYPSREGVLYPSREGVLYPYVEDARSLSGEEELCPFVGGALFGSQETVKSEKKSKNLRQKFKSKRRHFNLE